MRFGAELRRLRLEKNLTLRQLGEKAGVSFTYLSKIEGGKVDLPSKQALKRIAAALEISARELELLAEPEVNEDSNILELLQRILSQGQKTLRPQELTEGIRFLLDPDQILRKRRGVSMIWSSLGVSFIPSLWSLLYVLFRRNIKYDLKGAEKLARFIEAGRPILFTAQHCDVAALTFYLIEQTPGIPGLQKLVTMVSDSADGRQAQRFLKRARMEVKYVIRPTVSASNGHGRETAFREFLRLFRASGEGVAAAMVIDEREGRRERRICGGPILFAKRTGAVIIPVVARNTDERILQNSWDKHRIPLSTGMIFIGEPFEVMKGRGRKWRDGEAQKLEQRIAALDKTAEGELEIKSMPLRLFD